MKWNGSKRTKIIEIVNIYMFARAHTHIPAAKLVEWISTAVVRICFVSKNHTNSVRAFQIPNMYDFYVGSIRMRAQNWIHRHSPDWGVTVSILRSDLGAHTTDDFLIFWSQRYRWCHVSSTWPPARMFRAPKTPAPAIQNVKKEFINHFFLLIKINRPVKTLNSSAEN